MSDYKDNNQFVTCGCASDLYCKSSMLYKAPAVKPAFLCPLIREPRVLKISLRDLCVVSLKGLVNISTFGDLFPKLTLSDTTSLLFTLCSLQTIAFLIRDQSNVKLCLFGQSQLLVYWKQKKLIFCVCSKESNGFFFSFLMCFFFLLLQICCSTQCEERGAVLCRPVTSGWNHSSGMF